MIINGKEITPLKTVQAGLIEVSSLQGAKIGVETVNVKYVIHPNIQKFAKLWNFKPLNNTTWQGFVREERIMAFFQQLNQTTPLVIPEPLLTTSKGKPTAKFSYSNAELNNWMNRFVSPDIISEFKENEVQYGGNTFKELNKWYKYYCNEQVYDHADLLFTGILSFNFVRTRKEGHVKIFLKVRTNQFMGQANIMDYANKTHKVQGTRIPLYKVFDMQSEASYNFGKALALHFYDPENILKDNKSVYDKIILFGPHKGAPGSVDIYAGNETRTKTLEKKADLIRNRNASLFSLKGTIPLRKLEKMRQTKDMHFSPEISDSLNMVLSSPYKDNRLEPNQENVVGVHLATTKGFVNAAETGNGKTVTTLVAYKAKHERGENFNGLIICEANTRQQWTGETENWFPELNIFTLESRSHLEELKEFLTNTPFPRAIITSYSLAGDAYSEEEEELSELGNLLLNEKYTDICIDEGLCLRKTGKTHHALFALREQAETGVVLTATPFNTSKNDFARLISFARNDQEIFRGIDLDKEFDLNDPKDLKRWNNTMYPFVQRDTKVDKSKFPEATTEIVYVEPSIRELELSTILTKNIKNVLDDLIIATEKASNGKTPDLVAELRELRGSVVASTTLARQAATLPEAILESQSIASELVKTTSIFDADVPASKVEAIIDIAKAHKELEDTTIIFTSFKKVGEKMAERLRNEGLEVGTFFGGQGRQRELTLEEFNQGNLDVLVCTSAANRGLNLQNANVLIHADVDFTPDVLLQRCGRIIRRNSPFSEVKIYYVVLKDTIDAKVMGVAAARTAESILTSDALSSTEMNLSRTAFTVKGMFEQIDTSKVIMSVEGDKTVTLASQLLSVL